MSNLSYERNYSNIAYFFGKVNFMNYKSSLKILNKVLKENVVDNQQPQNNQQTDNQQPQNNQQTDNQQQNQQQGQQNQQKNGFNDEQQKAINACKTIFSNAKKNGNKLTDSDKQNLIANLQNLKKTLPR